MIKETVDYGVRNPFIDKPTGCMCEFELHLKGETLEGVEHVNLVSVVTEPMVEIINWIPEDEKESLELRFYNDYR